jgi:hypothetical protein
MHSRRKTTEAVLPTYATLDATFLNMLTLLTLPCCDSEMARSAERTLRPLSRSESSIQAG